MQIKTLILAIAAAVATGPHFATANTSHNADTPNTQPNTPAPTQPQRTPAADSQALIAAARAEIQSTNHDTACDLFLEKVLARAGYHVDHFLANEFGDVAARDLPGWKPREFYRDEKSDDRASLETFLNNSKDGTAFLAQWVRPGPHGHVALVVKMSANNFVIFQAQLGLSGPAEKPVKVDGLLYSKSDRGDRSHLRLFYE